MILWLLKSFRVSPPRPLNAKALTNTAGLTKKASSSNKNTYGNTGTYSLLLTYLLASFIQPNVVIIPLFQCTMNHETITSTR